MIEEEAKNTAQDEQLSGEGFAPIRMAALDGHVEMVKLLLEHKAAPEVQDEWGFISPEVFQVIREFGGKVGHIETLEAAKECSVAQDHGAFLDRLRQMSADRLLLEAPPAPQKPLGGLSPEAAARAYTRQADLLQSAAKIKQEHILLEEADLAEQMFARHKTDEHEPSQKAVDEIDAMLANRGVAAGSAAIRSSNHESSVREAEREAEAQRKAEEEVQKMVEEMEATARAEREARRASNWADDQIEAMLQKRSHVKNY